MLQLIALRQLTVLALTCSVLLIFAVTPGPKNDSIFCCLLVHMSRLMSFFVVNSRICSRAGAAQLCLLLVWDGICSCLRWGSCWHQQLMSLTKVVQPEQMAARVPSWQ